MNFFQRQAKAKSLSNRLVLLFILAVVAVVIAMMLLTLVLFGQPQVADGSQYVSLFSPDNLVNQSGLLLLAGAGSAGAMGIASLVRVAGLRGGGGKVARELGGQRVDPDSRDPLQRRLVNVVEEIALASGVPVPEIYVLDQESGINAFAAGYSASDAAVAVTRGTLETLNRSELQGVIAHEFSHILNGDMRLNIKLIGMLFGILVLALFGRKMLHGMRWASSGRNSNNNGAVAILAIAVGMVAIGYIGMFFARWIKAAVSRQREYLADASAVQFTRDPEGIAGALKKIAASQQGALLETESEEYSHMLFGEGRISNLFATHPPLEKRIKALDPNFRPEQITELAKKMARDQRRELEKAREEAKREADLADKAAKEKSAGGFDFSAEGIIDNIGNPTWQAILAAGVLADEIPANLLRAARHHEWAPAVVLTLLLDSDSKIQQGQFAAVNQHLGEHTALQVTELVRQFGPIERQQRLPLLEIALPAVKNRSRVEIQKIHTAIRVLSEADQKISPFEFLLMQLIQNYLQEALNPSGVKPHGNKSLSQRRSALQISMSALSWFGQKRDAEAASHAYQTGMQAVGGQSFPEPQWPKEESGRQWTDELQRALVALNQLAPNDKKRLVKGWLQCILHDGRANVHEMELLRAFCALVHVPMPPLSVMQ